MMDTPTPFKNHMQGWKDIPEDDLIGDLLAQLENAVNMLDRIQNGGTYTYGDWYENLTDMRAAIAKARGDA